MAFGKQHPEWPEFEKRILGRIVEATAVLENPGLNIDETNFTRGRIAELRALLTDTTNSVPLSATPKY